MKEKTAVDSFIDDFENIAFEKDYDVNELIAVECYVKLFQILEELRDIHRDLKKWSVNYEIYKE